MIRQVSLIFKRGFIPLSLIFLISCSDTPKDPSGEELREKAHQAYAEKHYEEALALYEGACQKGDGEGCFYVSNYFAIPKEQKNYFYDSSCSLGYARGCLLLGFYHSMRSNSQDVPKSLSYFSKSCDLGNEVACRIYKKGLK